MKPVTTVSADQSAGRSGLDTVAEAGVGKGNVWILSDVASADSASKRIERYAQTKNRTLRKWKTATSDRRRHDFIDQTGDGEKEQPQWAQPICKFRPRRFDWHHPLHRMAGRLCTVRRTDQNRERVIIAGQSRSPQSRTKSDRQSNYTLDQADKEFTAQVAIKFESGLHSLEDVENIRKVLNRYPGSTDVILVVDSFDSAGVAADNTGSGLESAGESSTATAVVEADTDTATTTSRVRYILTTGKDCQVSVGPEFQQALRDAIVRRVFRTEDGDIIQRRRTIVEILASSGHGVNLQEIHSATISWTVSPSRISCASK